MAVRWGKVESRCYYRQGMVRTSCEANLVANADEVGSEAKFSHGAEGGEQEKT